MDVNRGLNDVFLTMMKFEFPGLVLAILFVLIGSNSSFGQGVFTFMHDGLERTYFLEIPEGPTEGMPLVFALHGYSGGAITIYSYSGWSDISTAEGVAICYPQGTLDDIGVPHWNANLGISSTDDVGFLTELASHLQEEYGFSAECTFSCGFSNGGYMSYTLACERPDVFRAVGSVAGCMSASDQAACDPSEVVPVIHIHGTLDPTVNYDQGSLSGPPWSGGWGVVDIMEFWSDAMGTTQSSETPIDNVVVLDLTTVDFIRNYGAPGGQEFHHYRVNGGLHDWPDAWGNQDIDATALIWEFFASVCAAGPTDVDTELLLSKPVLVRVLDMLGREVEDLPGQLRLHIYSDGTVRKQVRLPD